MLARLMPIFPASSACFSPADSRALRSRSPRVHCGMNPVCGALMTCTLKHVSYVRQTSCGELLDSLFTFTYGSTYVEQLSYVSRCCRHSAAHRAHSGAARGGRGTALHLQGQRPARRLLVRPARRRDVRQAPARPAVLAEPPDRLKPRRPLQAAPGEMRRSYPPVYESHCGHSH